MRLTGQVAWITGSSSGNGRAIAERFAREGAAVLCSDIRADPDPRGFDEGPPTHELITAAGGRAAYVHCDVADAGQVEAATGGLRRASSAAATSTSPTPASRPLVHDLVDEDVRRLRSG